MKTVKEICLGVAVAGVVAGAGSTVACAVASAEPEAADSTTSVGNAEQTPARARTAHRGPVRTAAPAAADRGSQPAPAGAAADSDPDPAPRAPVRGNRTLRQPTVSVAAPAPAVDVPERTVIVDSPEPVATPAESVAPTVAVVAPRAVAATRSTRVAAAAVALVPAPVTPLVPVAPLPLPLPVPVLPVTPASSVTSASSTVSRSRQASASLAVVQIGDPAHVLLIGTDGTNLSKILEYAYTDDSGFKEAIDAGITGATTLVGHTTISGPSWTTILTGVWDNKSGVINNLFDPAPYTAWPTVFNLLENYDSGIDTAVVADWKYINDIAASGAFPVAKADNYFIEQINDSWADTDAAVTQQTIDLINAADGDTPTFIFSYQVQVDEAGHAYGGGSTQYKDAVINVGNNIADILDAVNASGEDWTVIITTDHGHQQSQGFGHGFQSPNETSQFVIFDQAGDDNDKKQNLAYSAADITPTILHLFGAPQRTDFDGVPLTTKTTSMVDPLDIKQALNDAIDAFGYPNIGTDLALGARTIFASVPYFLNGFVETITGQLQSIADQDIFLISGLAGVTEILVQITGDVLVATTQAIARVVAYLTGAGTIAPTDPPLTPPSASELVAGQLVLT